LQDQQVRLVEQGEFVGHDPGQGAGVGRMALLRLHVEAGRVLPVCEVLGALARIESHRVEVGHGHAPACVPERGRSRTDEMGVEGLRLGMGEDEVRAHGVALGLMFGPSRRHG